MRRKGPVLLLISACGAGLGEAAWGLSQQMPAFAWPDLSRHEFWGLGTLLCLALALAQAGFWRLAWGLPLVSGLRAAALGCLVMPLGFAWRLFQRPILPPPHDLALRSLQIFAAALAISALLVSFVTLLLMLARERKLAALTPLSAALRLAACLWVFYLLSSAWPWSWRMTGDQPHYLLMAQSLSRDHDLDLGNNYAQGDWKAFYDREELKPQYPMEGGHSYTEHKPLLPLLAAPLWPWLGQWSGLCVSSLIAATGCALLAGLLLSAGYGSSFALTGFALLALNAAWWTHAGAFYPDALSGVLILAGCAALAGQLPFWVAPFSIGAMAWCATRGYPAAAALSLLILFQAPRRPWKASLGALALISLSLALAMRQNAGHFGSADPAAAFDRSKSLAQLFPLKEIPRQALGQLLDQEYGLIFWAPVFFFALPGLRVWKRFRAFPALPFAIAAVPYYALVIAYWDWTGVMAPSRYLIPLLPMLALSACFALHQMKSKLWFWSALLVSVMSGLLVSILPWLNFSKMDGKNLILKALEGRLWLSLTRLFPSFMMWRSSSLIWTLIFFAGIILVLRNFRQEKAA